MSVRSASRLGVVTLTLDRPEARNALSADMLEALRAALAAVEDSADTRALALRANGTTFSAGGDFGAFRAHIASAPPPGEPDPIVGFNRAFGATLERLASLCVPTIAVVTGSAIGGGVGLVAACDFAFATADVTFRLPEVTLGLPPAQVAPFVADRIGGRAALRWMVSGETISAAEALRAGLIDDVVASTGDLEALVARTLDAIGRAEPAAVRATKRILLRDHAGSRAAALDFAAERFAEALRSGTASEGLAALQERRAPSWSSTLGRNGSDR